MRKLSSLIMLTLFSACSLIFGADLDWDFRIIAQEVYVDTLLSNGDSLTVTLGGRDISVHGFMVGSDCAETSADIRRFGQEITFTVLQKLKNLSASHGQGVACTAFQFEYEGQVHDLGPGYYLFSVVYQREEWNPPVSLAYSEGVQLR